MSLEAPVKTQVHEFLTKSGICFRRMPSGRVKVKRGYIYLCPEGTADTVVFLPCRAPKWFEFKGEGQKTSKDRKEKQAAFRDEVRALGHAYHIIESVEDAKAALL